MPSSSSELLSLVPRLLPAVGAVVGGVGEPEMTAPDCTELMDALVEVGVVVSSEVVGVGGGVVMLGVVSAVGNPVVAVGSEVVEVDSDVVGDKLGWPSVGVVVIGVLVGTVVGARVPGELVDTIVGDDTAVTVGLAVGFAVGL